MTRARQKLILVANRDYLARYLAGDFAAPHGHALWNAVCEVAESAVLRSSDVVGFDIPEQYAQLAGLLQPLTGAEFDAALARDLSAARARVIMVSPYVTNSRTKPMLETLQPACVSGEQMRVLSQPPSPKRDERVAPAAIEHFRSHGIVCEFKPAVHQKAVIIDDCVAYLGSLNPLSYGGNTREVMVRTPSVQFVSSLVKQLGLE